MVPNYIIQNVLTYKETDKFDSNEDLKTIIRQL